MASRTKMSGPGMVVLLIVGLFGSLMKKCAPSSQSTYPTNAFTTQPVTVQETAPVKQKGKKKKKKPSVAAADSAATSIAQKAPAPAHYSSPVSSSVAQDYEPTFRSRSTEAYTPSYHQVSNSKEAPAQYSAPVNSPVQDETPTTSGSSETYAPSYHQVSNPTIYVGPRGGVYHYSASGKKVYQKKH